ncbi:MAG: membrane dipeptidase [Rhodothermales bacterium]
MTTWNVDPRAERLHRAAIVWDNHTCLPLRPDDAFLPQLERFHRSGATMVVANVMFDNAIPWPEGVKVLAHFRRWILGRPDRYRLAGSVDDILRAKAEGQLAVAFDIEGMAALDGQVSMVSTYYDLGVRWMLIAYNRNNLAGGGCMDDDGGLTAFGREVIHEMARVGMMLCCSHTGERTCRDAFACSPNPVLLSHSNPRALVDHPRNVTDDLMRACAETGGVVGINGYGKFLQHGDASTENYVRHIDYAVSVVGPEHVSIALDYVFDTEELAAWLQNTTLFPFDAGAPAGLPQMVEPEQLPAITERLLALGYADEHVRAILGENLLRVARQVWK